MNISLPDELKTFIDTRIEAEGYGTSSEYVRSLIRRDRDRVQFREQLMDGYKTRGAGPLDADFFSGLRKHIKNDGNPTA